MLIAYGISVEKFKTAFVQPEAAVVAGIAMVALGTAVASQMRTGPSVTAFADGGIVGTKPYVSSATYIHKMSHYCGSCYYNKTKKVGDKACPFNSLYWNFYDKHENKLAKNPRIGMMYNVWRRMEQADYYLKHINDL